MCDYQCTSVRFIKLSNRIENSIHQRESNLIIFPRIGMLYARHEYVNVIRERFDHLCLYGSL